MLHSSISGKNSYFWALSNENSLPILEVWQNDMFLVMNSNQKISTHNRIIHFDSKPAATHSSKNKDRQSS